MKNETINKQVQKLAWDKSQALGHNELCAIVLKCVRRQLTGLEGSALLERNPQAAATARAAPRLDVSHQQWRSKATKQHTTNTG